MTSQSLVHIVDDDPAVRDSLQLLLKSAGIASVTHGSATEFLASFEHKRPACLLLDVRMPGINGLEPQRLLKRRGITVPVVVITGHGDVAMAVEALKDGAVDFIEKPCDDERVLASVAEALAKDGAEALRSVELAELRGRLDQLTEREREVMDLVTAGNLNKVIAGRLGISDRTVEIHKSKIMQKMRARNVSDLIRMALRLEFGR